MLGRQYFGGGLRMAAITTNAAEPAEKGSEAVRQVGENCSICLEPVSGEAYLDQCFHRFCYHCILQWSEMVLATSLARSGNPKRVAALECPLCKTKYFSIIHDFVSGTKFQRDYLLASDGSRFKLSEAHRTRLAVYAAHKAKERLERRAEAEADKRSSSGSEQVQGGHHHPQRLGLGRNSKTRNVRGVVMANKWLPCWVRRELQALMQDEDVEMVAHHVVGVVESLHKRARSANLNDTIKQSWYEAVAAAVRPFVFEDAEIFAEELWKFLDAGIDIAYYDQQILESVATILEKEIGSQAAEPVKLLELLDEDVEAE